MTVVPDLPETELVFTRRFSMGHRLIAGSSERCAMVHGHNEYVTVRLTAAHPQRLDGQHNMITPFANAKTRWHAFIDNAVDHALQLSDQDPLLTWFRTHEPERAQRIIVTPGDPTTELMAALLLTKLNAFLRDDGGFLTAQGIELKETPTNTVRLNGHPDLFIPPVNRPPEKCWWNRADQSIADS
nr:6-carboxytetrahydropterin synthase [uncultured Neokomagataea sp.]